mmetsp:Transcript_62443/g.148721  ORF Transcript_62443/g.148721 Transcript_62443/m.148721 type:complete len:287 (-) Transcript_62443:25-885(-)
MQLPVHRHHQVDALGVVEREARQRPSRLARGVRPVRESRRLLGDGRELELVGHARRLPLLARLLHPKEIRQRRPQLFEPELEGVPHVVIVIPESQVEQPCSAQPPAVFIHRLAEGVEVFILRVAEAEHREAQVREHCLVLLRNEPVVEVTAVVRGLTLAIGRHEEHGRGGADPALVIELQVDHCHVKPPIVALTLHLLRVLLRSPRLAPKIDVHLGPRRLLLHLLLLAALRGPHARRRRPDTETAARLPPDPRRVQIRRGSHQSGRGGHAHSRKYTHLHRGAAKGK